MANTSRWRTWVLILTGAVIMACRLFKSADAAIAVYDAHGRRDPFIPLIGQEKNVSARLTDVRSVYEVDLEGIAMGADGKRLAIINGEIMKVGDRVGDLEVKKIELNSVTISIDGNLHTINLTEEGRTRGEQ